ncbi:hypothetical protein NE237_012770 [Protea cynaroides]|uniref:LOB domain-containing protein n=1 Tax=Protea cynaroides TaxID=273540 RepID=A0A9Q0GXE4_9MAGN|nr:hypothetical protein NE237_012770 [Protea cynaroides]
MSKSSSNGGGPCGACKFLRRKCVKGCIFAPYFDSEEGTSHFAAVHKVFGASNVSKLLFGLPINNRHDAVLTVSYEALARIKDPVYGCVGQIFALQHQVVNLQAELAFIQAHLATLEVPPQPMSSAQSPASASLHVSSNSSLPSSGTSPLLDPVQLQHMFETASRWNQADHKDPINTGDLPAFA